MCQQYVQFYKKPSNCHPKLLYHFTFPLSKNENSCCSISLPAFGIINANFCHSNRCRVVFLSCFILYFSDDMQCDIFSYVYLPSVYIFLVRCLLRSLNCFKTSLFLFLLLSFKSSLHILDKGPWSEVSFENISSHMITIYNSF